MKWWYNASLVGHYFLNVSIVNLQELREIKHTEVLRELISLGSRFRWHVGVMDGGGLWVKRVALHASLKSFGNPYMVWVWDQVIGNVFSRHTYIIGHRQPSTHTEILKKKPILNFYVGYQKISWHWHSHSPLHGPLTMTPDIWYYSSSSSFYLIFNLGINTD